MSDRELRKLRGPDLGLIFQEPMTRLNPLMRIEEHFRETLEQHESKLTNKEIRSRSLETLGRMGIPPTRFRQYPHEFSGGMRQRIMIALALVLRPKLLVADEPTTSLDVIVEAQILGILADLRESFGTALLLITHNLGIVAEACDRVAVMYAGEIVEEGQARDVFTDPAHPYARELLRSTISLETTELHSIPGAPPNLIDPPPACRFHPRCPSVMLVCASKHPIELIKLQLRYMDQLGRAPLRALVELSRRGTMAAVAEELGYTAGAVPRSSWPGWRWPWASRCSKVGRGVRLTDAGRVLADHAIEVLRAEEAALAAVRAVGTDVVGRIVIGVFGSTAGALLAPLVVRLADEHPGITVLSRQVGVDGSAAAVRRGEVDVAFGVDYATSPMPRDVGTELVPLRTEVFSLAVAHDYTGADRIPLGDAAGWPSILTPENTPFGRAIRTACRVAGFEPEVTHEVTDTAAAILLATEGLGITPVTPLMRQLVAGEPNIVALRESVTRQVVLVRHRADRERPTVAAIARAAEVLAAAPAGEDRATDEAHLGRSTSTRKVSSSDEVADQALPNRPSSFDTC